MSVSLDTQKMPPVSGMDWKGLHPASLQQGRTLPFDTLETDSATPQSQGQARKSTCTSQSTTSMDPNPYSVFYLFHVMGSQKAEGF